MDASLEVRGEADAIYSGWMGTPHMGDTPEFKFKLEISAKGGKWHWLAVTLLWVASLTVLLTPMVLYLYR